MYQEIVDKKKIISVIGLGYVGLPIALEFAKQVPVVGFDIKPDRVKMMKNSKDPSNELTSEAFDNTDIHFTYDPEDLRKASFHVIAVPTPIDDHNLPDLKPLLSATETVGKVLKKGDYVVYESTVYPGCTEEECIPLLEKISGLKYNDDFKVGFSPERINPGDQEHTLIKIVKVVSGGDDESLDNIAKVYEMIIEAGIHKASSIKVAEAAKIIENTQRDINIGFMNELSIIFSRMGINTYEVLEAAGTKWNFLPFRPGLVGGHCIGVDPYYLTHKAIEVGYHPEMILAGRRLNDHMGSYVANQVSKLMTKKRIHVVDANILIMGLTFKEDCPDLRNTRVVDLVEEFQSFNCNVDVYDPWVDADEAQHMYEITPIKQPESGTYDAIILAVGHNQFKQMTVNEIHAFGKENHVLYDIKYILNVDDVDGRL